MSEQSSVCRLQLPSWAPDFSYSSLGAPVSKPALAELFPPDRNVTFTFYAQRSKALSFAIFLLEGKLLVFFQKERTKSRLNRFSKWNLILFTIFGRRDSENGRCHRVCLFWYDAMWYGRVVVLNRTWRNMPCTCFWWSGIKCG